MPQADATNPQTLRLTAPLQFAASAAGGADDALPANFTGTAYGGGLVASYGVVVDLSSTKIAPALPLLYEHMRSEIVGKVSTLEISKDFTTMPVAGELFSDVPEFASAVRIARLAKRGAPFQLSIGIFGYSEEWVPSGTTTKVNGRDIPGPCAVLRNGLVREVSVVTLGADIEAEATFFSQPGDRAVSSQDQMTIEQLTARVAELTAALAAKDSETAALKLAEAQRAAAARTAALERLLADTGERMEATERELLMSMTDAAFDAMANRMRGLAAKARSGSAALFRDVADASLEMRLPAKETSLSATDIYAARRKAQNQV